ncbi:MAG: AbrB/MazE/SpoVT family DNA-binding domain-containing protein [Enhydrobacter sp.]|nr:AbrB/MazE/SpoVT family DNA-binding domain-containing protein [Enhydrobacter sp.]
MTKRKPRPARVVNDEATQYIPSDIDQPPKPKQTAKLFKNGRSQAVRLPKEFRFEGE